MKVELNTWQIPKISLYWCLESYIIPILLTAYDKCMLSHSIYPHIAHPYPYSRQQQKKQQQHFFVILSLYSSTISSFLKLSWVRKRKYKVKVGHSTIEKNTCLVCSVESAKDFWAMEYWSLHSSCQLKIYRHLNTIHLVRCKNTSKIIKNIAYLRTWRRSKMINCHFQPHSWRCWAGIRWLSLLRAMWFPSWERVAVHKHTTAGGMGND